MCGIAGIVGKMAADGGDIAAMLRALAHRGPDGEGIYRDAGATLGHRRLSIIDLEGGRQPLRNQAGTIWLVCNGEIYNYVELRRQLESAHFERIVMETANYPPEYGVPWYSPR